MKQNKYFLNTLLTALLFAAMLAKLLVHVFQPAAVLPKLDIPNMVLLSLAALLIDHFAAPGAKRCYPAIALLSAAAFALLPLMAGFACRHTFWKYGLVGGAVFTVTTWLFSSMTERLASGPKGKAAVLAGALGLYLAAQCFAGMGI